MRTLCFLLLSVLVASSVAQSCDFSRGWACQGGLIQTLQFDDDEVTLMEAHSKCTIYQQGKFSVDDDEINIEFDGSFLGINFLDCDIIGEDDHECECYEDDIKFTIADPQCSTLEGENGEICTPARNTNECKFRTCPSGQRLLPNPNYESSANGCGPASFPITAPSFSFLQCCEQHDYCYGDCVDSKEKCDNDFYECMYCSCERGTEIEELLCEELACLYYQSVDTFGCAAYEASQAQGCICENEEDVTVKGGEIPSKFGPSGAPQVTRGLICKAPFKVSDSVCRVSEGSSLVISCFILLVVVLML